MSFVTGDKIRISIFGQSHSEAMGAVIDGLPAGFKIDVEKLSEFMARRAPGNDEFSTSRKEGDKVRIVSGITNGVTNGAPLCGIIENINSYSFQRCAIGKGYRAGKLNQFFFSFGAGEGVGAERNAVFKGVGFNIGASFAVYSK